VINRIPEDYREFLDRIQSSSSQKIISFAAKITKINLESLINGLSIKDRLFYWHQPSQKIEMLAAGNILRITASGFERTAETEKEIKNLQSQFSSNHNEFPGVSFPLFTGGLKFAPDEKKEIWNDYEDSDWAIPGILFFRNKENYYVIYNTFTGNFDREEKVRNLKSYLDKIKNIKTDNNSNKSQTFSVNPKENTNGRQNWIDNVNAALETIRMSNLHKVVLARKVSAEVKNEIFFEGIISVLAERYPDCYIFLFKSGNSIFFGASPEMLIRFSNGVIESDALAGSAPRGESKAEDEKIAGELLSSVKNLNEQKAVVKFISKSFSHFSDEIVFPEKPVIKKLTNIQHLFTPVKAKLKQSISLFEIIRKIHPTPAICGTPLMKAFEKIKQLEDFERGLYSGAVGWFNFNCEGEFAVSIRSGLYKENKIYAFAGCGIVEGSDPQAEYEESLLKLQPILSLFQNEKIAKS